MGRKVKVLVFKDIKNNRWTIWNLERTIHLGYADEITLSSASFIVVEEKRKRVVKSKKRFPHAWVVGIISNSKINLSKSVTYNPFKDSYFMQGNKKISKAKVVNFSSLGKVFV